MSPLTAYAELIDNGTLIADDHQQQLIKQFDRLHHLLINSELQANSSNLFVRLRQRLRILPQLHPIKGLYLWGGVGSGKTMLMDLFYRSLPAQSSLRLHFHHFMQKIHQRMATLKEQRNPLERVAAELAADTRVLCLDEFHVTDIADAMILGRLLKSLFSNGITLVTTSNIEPQKLYWDGLHRKRFLPTIELLQENTTVTKIASQTDFRLRHLTTTRCFIWPHDKNTNKELEEDFFRLTTSQPQAKKMILLERPLQVSGEAADVIWFTFAELCGGPRAVADYIQIANHYNTLILSEVPLLEHKETESKRFIHLIDELYDRRVKLILSLADNPTNIYPTTGKLRDEFARTVSRLNEMQSEEYLSSAHQAIN